MYNEAYKRWLEFDLEDCDLYPELARVQGNDEEIKDRFAISLAFGTAVLLLTKLSQTAKSLGKAFLKTANLHKTSSYRIP